MFKNVYTGDVITKYANFENFSRAIITLFRCATGEDWGVFVFDLGNASKCGEDNCGQSKKIIL